MQFEAFVESLKETQPPANLSFILRALWYDGKEEWDNAHKIIENQSDPDSTRIHAYLHRKEGDQWNASYWYNRAGINMPESSLEEEWKTLVKKYLKLDN